MGFAYLEMFPLDWAAVSHGIAFWVCLKIVGTNTSSWMALRSRRPFHCKRQHSKVMRVARSSDSRTLNLRILEIVHVGYASSGVRFDTSSPRKSWPLLFNFG